MSSGPGWVAYVVGTPVLTFVGSWAALFLARVRDRELEMRSKREETLRNMRWAAELSASDKSRLATLGVAQLEALLESDLLEDTEKIFVETALSAVYEDAEAKLDKLGDDAEAVQYVDDVEDGLTAEIQTEITSDSQTRDGGNDGGEEGRGDQRPEVGRQGDGEAQRREGPGRLEVRAEDRERETGGSVRGLASPEGGLSFLGIPTARLTPLTRPRVSHDLGMRVGVKDSSKKTMPTVNPDQAGRSSRNLTHDPVLTTCPLVVSRAPRAT